MYVELYEETQRFDDEALQASIQWYQDEEGDPEPMQGDDDFSAGSNGTVGATVVCPVCARGALTDLPAGVMCKMCAMRLHDTRASDVDECVRAITQAHASVCGLLQLEWAVTLPSTLHCRCRGCGATTLKVF